MAPHIGALHMWARRPRHPNIRAARGYSCRTSSGEAGGTGERAIRRTLSGVRSRLTVGPGRSCYRVGIAAPGCVEASWEHSMDL